MELKVANSQFGNNGGGGGTFYMGRGQGDGQRRSRRDEEEEAPPELAADAFEGGDQVRIPVMAARQPSQLSLWAPRPVAAPPVDEDALVAELEQAVNAKLRLLGHAVWRMERDYARRLRAEIGEMVIGA